MGFSGLLFAAVVILGTLAVSLLVYRLGHAFFFRGTTEQTIDLARVVLLRLGVLHSLVVALVFAAMREDEAEFWNAMAGEAAALADVIYALEPMDDEQAQVARQAAITYARAALGREWVVLASEGALDRETWDRWSELRQAVLAIEPKNRQETVLLGRVIDEVFKIEDLRQQRALFADNAASIIFWIAAIAGHFLIMLGFAAYPPNGRSYLLIGLFATYTGLMLYLIAEMGTPLTGLNAFDQWPYRTLLRDAL